MRALLALELIRNGVFKYFIRQLCSDICHKKLVAIYCISCVVNIAYTGNIKDKMSYGKYSELCKKYCFFVSCSCIYNRHETDLDLPRFTSKKSKILTHYEPKARSQNRS